MSLITACRSTPVLSDFFPALAAEADTDEPLPLGSRHEVWWTCPDCQYYYPARVSARVAGFGCPACTGFR